MKDVLRPYVPDFKGVVSGDEEDCKATHFAVFRVLEVFFIQPAQYLQLQDLLSDFNKPCCVMDCKIGVRTYLEEELLKAKEKQQLRKVSSRFIQHKHSQMWCYVGHVRENDSDRPQSADRRRTSRKRSHKATIYGEKTTSRCLIRQSKTFLVMQVWRETISSTANLGFRIEGIKKDDLKSKDFKTIKAKDEIKDMFREFCAGYPHALVSFNWVIWRCVTSSCPHPNKKWL